MGHEGAGGWIQIQHTLYPTWTTLSLYSVCTGPLPNCTADGRQSCSQQNKCKNGVNVGLSHCHLVPMFWGTMSHTPAWGLKCQNTVACADSPTESQNCGPLRTGLLRKLDLDVWHKTKNGEVVSEERRYCFLTSVLLTHTWCRHVHNTQFSVSAVWTITGNLLTEIRYTTRGKYNEIAYLPLNEKDISDLQPGTPKSPSLSQYALHWPFRRQQNLSHTSSFLNQSPAMTSSSNSDHTMSEAQEF